MPSVAPKASIAGLVARKPPLPGPTLPGAPTAGRIVRLHLNEGALGPSPRAMEAMRAVAERMDRYPGVDASGLARALGRKHGIDPERILLGCGSDELIQFLCLAYVEPGEEVIHTQYGFLLFPMAARIAGGVPVSAPDDGFTASVDAILERVTPRTKLVFLANPNNPTGTCLPAGEVRRLREGLPDRVLLVVDAAYAEYVQRDDYTAGIELVEATDNTVMLRTFSKAFGMAGLRLGWAYCPQPVADTLYSVRPPYGVNAPSLAAGLAAVEDRAFQDATVAHNARWMPWLQERFRALGLEPLPTAANFMMLRFPVEPGRNADAVRPFLAGRGILVREMAGYGAPEYIRLSVGREDENRLVVDAVRDFLNGANA
jgi:histidinol-phosphate aminotransferase